jgi:TIR domain/Bacterial regulatory protein, Fis family
LFVAGTLCVIIPNIMDLFISWSGKRSGAAAEILKGWLQNLINDLEPWLSAEIHAGTDWNRELADKLKDCKAGIICLTPSNLHSDWIHFEAGALSKTVDDAYVCPFLIDLERSAIGPPLSKFQSTRALEEEDVLQLVRTLNKACKSGGEKGRDEHSLEEAFKVWWPLLKPKLQQLPDDASVGKARRSDRDILEELLELVRTQNRAIARAPTDSEAELREREDAPFSFSISEKELIKEALEASGGNVTKAAVLLGYKSRQTILNKMDRFGIPRDYGEPQNPG